MPACLEGRDVLGLAQTGTGKTAAFALPILQRILADPGRQRSGPRALIVAPTRELAAQIQAETDLLARFTKVRSAVVFGGVSKGPQVRALASRPEIVVACPGRLLDLLSDRALKLDSVETLVLDEADHMFDMGFLPDVRRILRALPKRRQNLLFSATMPGPIRSLADEVLNRPKVVELNHSAPASTIEHRLCRLRHKDEKLRLLRDLLDGEDFTSAIVFLRTKHRAKRLALQLAKLGHDATALQGNMSQGQRERAMEGFRSGRFDVLVATDIAARGIDVSGVSHVVNYDVPNTPEAYTHRIGRTGRSEREGKAFTFALPEDSAGVRAIERHLGSPIAPHDGERAAADASGGRGRRRPEPEPERSQARPARSRGEQAPARKAPARKAPAQRPRAEKSAGDRARAERATPERKRDEPTAAIPFGALEWPVEPPRSGGSETSSPKAPAGESGGSTRRRRRRR